MDYQEILKKYWGYETFRGIQREIIESVGQGRDTLGLMPTGGGKSICFQVPTLAGDGLCLVITPLISLMRDQVDRLRGMGILAECIHAGMSRDEVVRILDNCLLGDYKFLYVAPERLGSDLFQAKLPYFTRVSLLCVDEAHCISQWGFDFRPAYLQIARLRRQLPRHVPVLALTATATVRVAGDIMEQLEFAEPNCISMSFERENLSYVVRRTPDKEAETIRILQRYGEGSAIVYTRSRQLTGLLSQRLVEAGITAENYHAGLTMAERNLRYANWMKGRDRVMVATNAFGMGIDKPDVRLVIHYNLPDSLEAYFQEAGRAGRDGQTAYAVLLYDPVDQRVLRRRVTEQYPDRDFVTKTYENICYYYQIGVGEGANQTHLFAIDDFCRKFHQFGVQTDSALRLLDHAGYLEYRTDNDMRSRLRFALSKNDLYALRNNGVEGDRIIEELLRNYGGLFVDFVLIDETLLAHATGLTPDRVYDLLKLLAQRRIIDYIPRNNQPTVKLRIGRVETRHLTLPPEVYEERKRHFASLIRSMLEYADNQTVCRSRMLLYYFGQRDGKDCGRCDVCLARKKRRRSGFLASV